MKKSAILILALMGIGTRSAAQDHDYTQDRNTAKPEPFVEDGHPALRLDVGNGWTTVIALVERNGEESFRFAGEFHGSHGYLYMTPTRIAYDPSFSPDKSQDTFDILRSQIEKIRHWKAAFELKAQGNKYTIYLTEFSNGPKRAGWPKSGDDKAVWNALIDVWGWMDYCRSNFQAAVQEFRGITASLNLPVSTEQQIAFEEFKEKARSWRALTQKPELPEEVRKHRVLAEYAVQEKDIEKAMNEYEAGLKIYPLWPEGQFNAALLCEEKKLYAKAIGYMKRYLELVPNASDAQAARDKITIWEDKLGH